MKPQFELYLDQKKEWRWRFRATNGEVIADSAEGYENRMDCLHGVDLVKADMPNASVLKEEH